MSLIGWSLSSCIKKNIIKKEKLRKHGLSKNLAALLICKGLPTTWLQYSYNDLIDVT